MLADPLLQPLFGEGQPHHVEHLTMFAAERFREPRPLHARRDSATSSTWTAARASPRPSAGTSSSSIWRRSTRPGCGDDERFRRVVREHVEFGPHEKRWTRKTAGPSRSRYVRRATALCVDM
jgi:hemoglobin